MVRDSRKHRIVEGRETTSSTFQFLTWRERRKERHRGRKGAMLKPERFDWIRSRLSDFVMYKKSK
jgi:hypothetical protein